MLSPGDILQERYRIVRKLGMGGMGAVYEAVDERFETPIALKEIIFASGNDKQQEHLAAAFGREAKSLATARHEAVPFVRDYFSEGDRQFLVMELIEGDDLAELLDHRKKPFHTRETVEWIRQLLDALDYLHDLKPPIIHRDIKPHNLKLNSRQRLKLLDFGIAKSGDMSALTLASRTFIGATLSYSPIEQILRVIDPTFREFIILKHEAKAKAVLSQNTDARADIFAVGATFYHLLTNQVPEDATKRTLDIWEGKPDPLPHPSDLNPAVSRAFGDFLLKAMAVERRDRFGSAAEMLEAMNGASEPGIVSRGPKEAPTVALPVEQGENIPPVVDPTHPASAEHVPSAAATEPLASPTPRGASTEPLVSPVQDSVTPTATDMNNWSELVSRQSYGGTLPNGVADLRIQQQATVPDRSLPVDLPAKRGSKIFWMIPATAVLAVAAIGGGVVMMNGLGNALNAPAANSRGVQEPTPYQSVTQSPTPDVWVSPTPISTPMPNVTVAHTPRPKPKPVGHPQKKTPPKRVQDPNCVYTDECKQ